MQETEDKTEQSQGRPTLVVLPKSCQNEAQLETNLTSSSYAMLRIVCMSDTHNLHERMVDNLIAGDMLIHTGDFSNNGTIEEIESFNQFLGIVKERYGFRYIVLIPGNHDKNLDPTINPTIDQDLQILLSNVTHYLRDSAVTIEGIKFYGTPWTNLKNWAFFTRDLQSKWRNIPEDTDILLTHFPPLNILDLTCMNSRSTGKICTLCNRVHDSMGHTGCKHLRSHVLERIKPKIHIFGHVHESYGTQQLDNTLFINCSSKGKPMHPVFYFDYPLHPQNTNRIVLKNYDQSVSWICEVVNQSQVDLISSFYVRNREHLLKTIPYPEETFTHSQQYSLQFIQRVVCDNNFILLNEDGTECIGICGVKRPISPQVGEIGYLIDHRFEGKGIISATVAFLLKRVFVEQPNEMAQKIQQLEIHCARENRKAQSVAIRFGFNKREDTTNQTGGIVHYVLTRDNYLSNTQ